MTETSQINMPRPPRHYKALEVGCPECREREGQPCVDNDGQVMLGVHRRRDILYNTLAWEER